MTLLAALAAALAVGLWLRPPPARRLALARGAGRAASRWLAGSRRLLAPVVAALCSVVGLLGWGETGAAVAFAGCLPVLTAVLLWRRQRARRAATVAADQVAVACQQLAALLRVGHVPGAALRLAARDSPVLAAAAATLEVGGEVAAVLSRRSLEPGLAGLAQLGVAWSVAERTGASLTATLDALAERLAAERKLRGVVAAELSAPRATGRLLAGLPVAGLLLGYGLGGDPLGFLTGSLPGRLCLVLGSLLGCAGVLWTEHIASSADGR